MCGAVQRFRPGREALAMRTLTHKAVGKRLGLCPCSDRCEIPYGECHCRCGGKTKLASKTYRSKGLVKGQPARFLHGHRKQRCNELHPGQPRVSDGRRGCRICRSINRRPLEKARRLWKKGLGACTLCRLNNLQSAEQSLMCPRHRERRRLTSERWNRSRGRRPLAEWLALVRRPRLVGTEEQP